jgi:hypothetical protein
LSLVSIERILRADVFFLTFSGLLLISAPDFGYPGSVNLALAVERPASGLWKFATSVQFGEPEDSEENGEGSGRGAGKYAASQDEEV